MKSISLSLIALLLLVKNADATNLVGRVYSDQGRPVSAAMVVIQPTVIPASMSAIVSSTTPTATTATGSSPTASSSSSSLQRTTTDAQGKFTVTVPDSTTYSICVSAPQQNLLGSCDWPSAPNPVKIATAQTSAQTSAQMNITLQTGFPLTFRLNDPQNLLPAPGTTSGNAFVQFGIWDTNGHYHPASEVSGDSLGRNHQVLIPLSTAIKISVWASGVRVLDANQQPVGPATAVAFSSQPSNLGQAFKYQVAPLGN